MINKGDEIRKIKEQNQEILSTLSDINNKLDKSQNKHDNYRFAIYIMIIALIASLLVQLLIFLSKNYLGGEFWGIIITILVLTLILHIKLRSFVSLIFN